jgi:hypothetical protein
VFLIENDKFGLKLSTPNIGLYDCVKYMHIPAAARTFVGKVESKEGNITKSCEMKKF